MFLATIRIFSQGVIGSSPSQLEDLFMGYKLGSCSLFLINGHRHLEIAERDEMKRGTPTRIHQRSRAKSDGPFL